VPTQGLHRYRLRQDDAEAAKTQWRRVRKSGPAAPI
jgi:hypothetical protein